MIHSPQKTFNKKIISYNFELIADKRGFLRMFKILICKEKIPFMVNGIFI